MITLKQAREQGRLNQFSKEQDRNRPSGDEDAFNRALASMAGKSKAAPEACKPDRSDD